VGEEKKKVAGRVKREGRGREQNKRGGGEYGVEKKWE